MEKRPERGARGETDRLTHKSRDSKHAASTASSLQRHGQFPSETAGILKYGTQAYSSMRQPHQQTQDTMLSQVAQAERSVGPEFTHSTRRLRLNELNWGFATLRLSNAPDDHSCLLVPSPHPLPASYSSHHELSADRQHAQPVRRTSLSGPIG
jgi:hypothetical protein